MTTSRTQGVANARKLLRTFASAPDARRRAQEFHQALARISELTTAERADVAALADWLRQHPVVGQLKPGCEVLLARLT